MVVVAKDDCGNDERNVNFSSLLFYFFFICKDYCAGIVADGYNNDEEDVRKGSVELIMKQLLFGFSF